MSEQSKPNGQTKSDAAIKKYSPDEVRKIIREIALVPSDPETILKELGEDLLPKMFYGDKKQKEDVAVKITEKASEALMLDELDNHYFLAETSSTKYRPLAIDYARKLSKEYNCTSPSEKGLVELITGAYIRYIEYSGAFNNAMRLDYLSHEKNAYYTMLSKEVDKAHRQYLTGLATLQQIKNPPPEWKINAKTAFISQNQQINAVNQTPPQEIKQDEINEPK